MGEKKQNDRNGNWRGEQRGFVKPDRMPELEKGMPIATCPLSSTENGGTSAILFVICVDRLKLHPKAGRAIANP